MSAAPILSHAAPPDDSKRRWAARVRRVPVILAAAQALWRWTRPRFSLGAVGIVFSDRGQLLLVEHVFHPYHPWGLPGGWVERGESPSATVRRELREELELDVEVGPVVSAELGFSRHLDLAFLCYPRSSVGKLCSEIVDYQWVWPDNLPEMHPFHRKAILAAVELRGLHT